MKIEQMGLEEIGQKIQDVLIDKIDVAQQYAQLERDKQAFKLLREYSTRPSKRIRGSLVVLTHLMFGGKDTKNLLDMAAAIELIQNYLLIIDDVADRSSIRRGAPTLHKIYLKELQKREIPEWQRRHLSNMLAVHVGLVASHLASKIMSDVTSNPALAVKASSIFHENLIITGLGQINDLYNPLDRPGEKETLENLSRKSSYYTFISPMQLGAAMAGASEKSLKQISDFGLPAGITFQLQDDILGLFGNPDDSGKSNIDDLREGKHTLLIQNVLASCTAKQREYILNTIGKENITEEQAEKVRNIVKSRGAYEYTHKLARKYADQAKRILLKQPWAEREKGMLLEMINSLEDRNQ